MRDSGNSSAAPADGHTIRVPRPAGERTRRSVAAWSEVQCLPSTPRTARLPVFSWVPTGYDLEESQQTDRADRALFDDLADQPYRTRLIVRPIVTMSAAARTGLSSAIGCRSDSREKGKINGQFPPGLGLHRRLLTATGARFVLRADARELERRCIPAGIRPISLLQCYRIQQGLSVPAGFLNG